MATLADIRKIHATGKAILNKIYVASTGETFIGLKSGRLKPYIVQTINVPIKEKTPITASSQLYYDSEGNTIQKKSYSDSSHINLIETIDYVYINGTLTSFTITNDEGVKTKTLVYDGDDNLTQIQIT